MTQLCDHETSQPGCGTRRYSRVSDWRDLTIMAFADDEAELRARVIDLEAQRDRYREEAQEAIHVLAQLTAKLKRLTAEYYRLRDQVRATARQQ